MSLHMISIMKQRLTYGMTAINTEAGPIGRTSIDPSGTRVSLTWIHLSAGQAGGTDEQKSHANGGLRACLRADTHRQASH